MIVTRNAQKEAILLDALVASFGLELPALTAEAELQVRGAEIHVSDLLKVRQAYWSRVLPLAPRRDEALNFTTGRAHEEILHRRLPLTIPAWKIGERRFKHGLQYRPDADWAGRPTEFKTRIRNLARTGEEAVTYDNYLEQLQSYVALDATATEPPPGQLPFVRADVNSGQLIVLSLAEGMDINNNRVPTHRELAVYDVEFSPFDISHILQHLFAQRDALLLARKTGETIAMRLCPEWMCGKQRKVVESKARCTKPGCDVAHRLEKEGHVMVPEVARYEYDPRCKWKVFCRPELVDPTRQAR